MATATPPTLTACGTQTGNFLKEGFPTTLAFSLKPNVGLWPVSITPPGLDASPISLTHMGLTKYEISTLSQLIKVGQVKMTCLYDPAAQPDLVSLVGKSGLGSVTMYFAGGAGTLTFYGGIAKLDFKELKEKTRGECDVTIEVTNCDAAGLEAGPVYASGGTA
jgi:hypothetical protein